jgi:hypothetical protein
MAASTQVLIIPNSPSVQSTGLSNLGNLSTLNSSLDFWPGPSLVPYILNTIYNTSRGREIPIEMVEFSVILTQY